MKREIYRLLDLRQMCMASAAAMSSSRNWGAATEIRPSGLGGSQVRAYAWCSGVSATAGSQATGSWEQLLYQGKALAVEVPTNRGAGSAHRMFAPSM